MLLKHSANFKVLGILLNDIIKIDLIIISSTLYFMVFLLDFSIVFFSNTGKTFENREKRHV